MTTTRIGVAGCGYWGKNLVRVTAEIGALEAVCDADPAVAQAMAETHGVRAATWAELLADPAIDGVMIAAPAALHRELAVEAVQAGKHIFVEKPLALTLADADAIVAAAAAADRVCMVGHLLQYHPVFEALKALVDGGELGRLRYVYSNRLNLGKVRREEDSLWSFAPHDISMILALVGEEPSKVTATGHSFLRADVADTTTTSLEFPSGVAGHIFVSWLHPFKEQRLVVVGDSAMAVFDDSEEWDEKLALYHHDISWKLGSPVPTRAEATFRAVPRSEPLRNECQHFLDAVAGHHPVRTDGDERSVCCEFWPGPPRSMQSARWPPPQWPRPVVAQPAVPGHPGVHETAVIDDGVTIGDGTRIWHFSHVLTGSSVGANCSLGQNVVVGPNVSVGDGCKIQNNVSVFEGVTLEDEVFCGPSCVFTNVNNPRAAVVRKDEYRPTVVRTGASIGANATIVCGVTLGSHCFIAAGATVTRDVPEYALMAGTPARRIGWMSRQGHRLGPDLTCPETGERYVEVGPDELRLASATDASTEVTSPIQFADLVAHRAHIGAAIDANVADVIGSGHFILGRHVTALEEELAEFSAAADCVTCASGTDALLMPLMALGIGRGDAVFVPTFTFVATAEVVALLGATPVFVDSGPDLTMDVDSLAMAVKSAAEAGLRPAAVIPVDIFGAPAAYAEIDEVARPFRLPVLADAAQSFGGMLGERPVGTLADATATSFFPAKPLGCYGDGGAVLTLDPAFADELRSIRAHGKGDHKYANVRIGINGRLDALQAAVLRPKLEHFPTELQARRAVAAAYVAALGDRFEIPQRHYVDTSAWAQFTLLVDERDRFIAHLKSWGVPTAIYYPAALHAQPAFAGSVGNSLVDLDRATAACERAVSLPMHPYLTTGEIGRIVDAALSFKGEES
ncbi:MAG: aminotransferase class I/II-fold pyridoxal phosphate-dependent enzyme [Acidimicrobiales bacterium]